jgi:hypothetical protein
MKDGTTHRRFSYELRATRCEVDSTERERFCQTCFRGLLFSRRIVKPYRCWLRAFFFFKRVLLGAMGTLNEIVRNVIIVRDKQLARGCQP